LHYDLLIRGGVCVLPWGEEDADVSVLEGCIAAIGALGDGDRRCGRSACAARPDRQSRPSSRPRRSGSRKLGHEHPRRHARRRHHRVRYALRETADRRSPIKSGYVRKQLDRTLLPWTPSAGESVQGGRSPRLCAAWRVSTAQATIMSANIIRMSTLLTSGSYVLTRRGASSPRFATAEAC
jgi:hypothetical protein